jgi:hypothetical protein
MQLSILYFSGIWLAPVLVSSLPIGDWRLDERSTSQDSLIKRGSGQAGNLQAKQSTHAFEARLHMIDAAAMAEAHKATASDINNWVENSGRNTASNARLFGEARQELFAKKGSSKGNPEAHSGMKKTSDIVAQTSVSPTGIDKSKPGKEMLKYGTFTVGNGIATVIKTPLAAGAHALNKVAVLGTAGPPAVAATYHKSLTHLWGGRECAVPGCINVKNEINPAVEARMPQRGADKGKGKVEGTS